jgi:hypothetical protein
MENDKPIERASVAKLKRLLQNGIPELTLLMLTARNGGAISNREIQEQVDEPLRKSLSPQILSRARKHLNKNGLRCFNSFGSHYELSGALETQYMRLFSAALTINKLIDEENDLENMNKLIKKGLVKR